MSTSLPKYPVSEGEPGPTEGKTDIDRPVGGKGYAKPPLGDHGAVGGRVDHRKPDGGTGFYKAPPGWPNYEG